MEFLNDIEGTKYETLKSLSNSQLKNKLVGTFSKEMEPYLKNHRKTLITLELEKKDKYKNIPAEELVSLFNSAIKVDDLDKASVLQNSIFQKLKYFEVSPILLNKMEIPQQLKYVNYLNNRSAFKYQLNDNQLIIVRNELEALLKLDPKNPKNKI